MRSGECIYCGQVMQVEAPQGASLEEVNRLATMGCKCTEGTEFRRIEETKSKARTNIDLLFRENYPEMANILEAALYAVSQGSIDQVSIKEGNTTGKIMLTSKGHIKVERSEVQKEAIENK